MVFQGFNLFNNMDVLDNCTLAPVTLKKMSKAEAEKVALEHLASVGLENSPMPRLVACPVVKNSAWPSPAPYA